MPLGRERSQARAARREQGTGRGRALPLSPHRGGYLPLKAREVFLLCAEEFPHLAGPEDRSAPGSGLGRVRAGGGRGRLSPRC